MSEDNGYELFRKKMMILLAEGLNICKSVVLC